MNQSKDNDREYLAEQAFLIEGLNTLYGETREKEHRDGTDNH
jgi:hypothetical protein